LNVFTQNNFVYPTFSYLFWYHETFLDMSEVTFS